MNNRTCFEHIKLLFGQACYSYNSVMGGGGGGGGGRGGGGGGGGEVMPH